MRRNWEVPSPFIKVKVRKMLGAISVARPHVQTYPSMRRLHSAPNFQRIVSARPRVSNHPSTSLGQRISRDACGFCSAVLPAVGLLEGVGKQLVADGV